MDNKLANLPIPLGAQMRKNRYRTAYLFLVFPIIILGLSYLGFLIAGFFVDDPTLGNPIELANAMMSTVGFWIIVGVFVYSLISYFFGSRMLLAFAGAKPIQKKDAVELYRVVENVSIAAGLPKTPDIYIIEDQSLNAFATGLGPKDGKVAISRGLLERLTKAELEGVMAHEIGHILNRDIRVMLLAVTLVGAIEMIGEILIRIQSGDREKSAVPFWIVGILFLTIGVLLGTLTRFAISREREYLADTTAAYLTSNPKALASALAKIAGDARIEVLDGKSSMAGLCIADPTESGHEEHTLGLSNRSAAKEGERTDQKPNWFVRVWRNAWSTHPPITERIDRLENWG